MSWRYIPLLLLLPLLGACDSPPPQKKPAKSKQKSSGEAKSSYARKKPASQVSKAGQDSQATSVPKPRRLSSAELQAESQRHAAGHMKFDCEYYLKEKVRFCRYSMRRDIEEFNKVAASMIKLNKYSSQLSNELNAARSNLDNRQAEADSPHPKLASLDKVQRELHAALKAYEVCLHDIYEPLDQAIEARKFEGDAPIEALERAIADGNAALEAWEQSLDAAVKNWETNGQAEIAAAVAAQK